MGLRNRLRRLRDQVFEGEIVVHLKNGSVEIFDKNELGVLFVEKMNKAFRDPDTPNCTLREALLKATPKSFQVFEQNHQPLASSFGVVHDDRSITLYHVLK